MFVSRALALLAGILLASILLASILLPVAGAHAHGVCGPRLFASTLTIEDPAIADEVALPGFSWSREGMEDGKGPTHEYEFEFEFAKRITPNLAISLGTGFSLLDTRRTRARLGWHNLELGLKYGGCIDPEREFMLAFGISREFGRTGTTHLGAEAYGSTTPTLYFGKGFTEAPLWWLRPVALTGSFGFTAADKGLRRQGDDAFNRGAEHRWAGGLALQYDIRYLQTGVRHIGLPDWANRLTPLLELTWSSPATAPSRVGTRVILAPGLAWRGDWYQFSVAALLPLNRASGANVGAMAQLRIYLDDVLPGGLGKPVSEW